MRRSLSPMLRRELENLDKDECSRESAMRALKSYVKDLDSNTIPIFLAQVWEIKETGALSGEFTISLYEVLAMVHGATILPLIDNIMQSIVQTLATSAGSFPLQQACSKVVPAIARYGIDPSTPEDKKRHIIHSICKPLSDSLSSSQETLTSGAALCLKALVDSSNWRFASDEIVNRVCQNVAVALEGQFTQMSSHMDLVMALAKHNPLIVEAYARLLIQSGLKILNAGANHLEGNSQKRFAAIQMVNFLMKCIDPRSIYSEIESIIEGMEMCQSDKMVYVKGAALEAMQTAKRIAIGRKIRCVKSPASVIGSDFGSRDYMDEGSFSSNGDHSPTSISPESQNLGFFPGYGSIVESPMSMTPPSRNLNLERRSSVNRKLWSQENGRMDLSFKDSLFSEAVQGNALLEHTQSRGSCNRREDLTDEFPGFMHRRPWHGVSRSTNTSPLRSRTLIKVDSIKTSKTPRKLTRSLQDPDDVTSYYSEKPNRRFRSLSSGNIDWSPASYSKCDQNGILDNVNYNRKENESSCADVQYQGGPESVSSTDDIAVDSDMQRPPQVFPENKNDTQAVCMEKPLRKTKRKLVCGLSLFILAMATPLLWINNQGEGDYLVPT